MEEEFFFHQFPGFLANAAVVCHPITQVNITHTGCIVFNDQRLHSFPTFPEVTFRRWNVNITKAINFSFVLPTHSHQISQYSGHRVSSFQSQMFRAEIREHLLPALKNCTACIYFPVV
jgi:hypothetical protein